MAKITNMGPRFPKEKESPGPLTYKEGDDLSSQGKYVLSNHKSNGIRGFSRQNRNHFTDDFSLNKIAPGPGAHEKPSEFGVYGDAKYYKTMSSMKATIG